MKPGTMVIDIATDFKRVFQYLGVNFTGDFTFEQFCAEIDFYHRGVLDFRSFLAAVRNLRELIVKHVYLPNFQRMDPEKTGCVSVDELGTLALACGFTMTKQVVTELVEFYPDLDPDEVLSPLQQLKPRYPSLAPPKTISPAPSVTGSPPPASGKTRFKNIKKLFWKVYTSN